MIIGSLKYKKMIFVWDIIIILIVKSMDKSKSLLFLMRQDSRRDKSTFRNVRESSMSDEISKVCKILCFQNINF